MVTLPPLAALRAFEATVRLGGLARSAVELNLTTSTIRRRVTGRRETIVRRPRRRVAAAGRRDRHWHGQTFTVEVLEELGRVHQPVACGPGDLVEGHIRFGRHRVCILGPYLSPLCKGRRESNRDLRRVDGACNGWPTCRVVARGKVGRQTKLLVQKPRRNGGLCSCSFSGHTASEHVSSKWSCAP